MVAYIGKSVSQRQETPTKEELELLGMTSWQIAAVKSLPPTLQWIAHDEYIRVLMSGGDPDSMDF